MPLLKEEKKNIIEKMQRHSKDTGSPDVQIKNKTVKWAFKIR